MPTDNDGNGGPVRLLRAEDILASLHVEDTWLDMQEYDSHRLVWLWAYHTAVAHLQQNGLPVPQLADAAVSPKKKYPRRQHSCGLQARALSGHSP